MPLYAVRAGWIPGIYESWPEAQAQVKGYSKPQFHRFERLQDARGYMALAQLPKNEQLHISLDERGVCLHSPTIGQLMCVPPGSTRYQSEVAVLQAFINALADALGDVPVGYAAEDKIDHCLSILVDSPAILKLNKAGAAFHTGPLALLGRCLTRLPATGAIKFVLSDTGREVLNK